MTKTLFGKGKFGAAHLPPNLFTAGFAQDRAFELRAEFVQLGHLFFAQPFHRKASLFEGVIAITHHG